MAPIPTLPQPTVIVIKETTVFPTAAIIVLAIGGYMFLFGVVLIIRKFIIQKGDIFPAWCSEVCACQTACCCMNAATTDDEPGCLVSWARSCNFPLPGKRHCQECLPTKEWCDNTFCSGCNNNQPNDCNCMKDANCGNCDGCFDCSECKDCFDCKCDCCSTPDTIDCCCLEVKLSGSRQPPGGGGGYPGAGYPGGHNNPGAGYPGGHNNPGGHNMMGQYGGFPPQQLNQPNNIPVGQQFYTNPAFNPGQSMGPGPSINPAASMNPSGFGQAQFNPGQSFNPQMQPANPFQGGNPRMSQSFSGPSRPSQGSRPQPNFPR